MVGLGASCIGRGPCRGPLGAETEGTPSWGPGLFVVLQLQGVSLTSTDPTGSCCVVAVVGQSRRTKSPASSGSGRRVLARPAPCPMRSTHRSSLPGRRASPRGARFSLTPTSSCTFRLEHRGSSPKRSCEGWRRLFCGLCRYLCRSSVAMSCPWRSRQLYRRCAKKLMSLKAGTGT